MKIIRGITTSLSLNFTLLNNLGPEFNSTQDAGDANFETNFFVAKSVPSDWTDPTLNAELILDNIILGVNIADGVLQKGLTERESVDASALLQLSVDPDYCTLVKHVCINVTEGLHAAYVEQDHTNQISCIDISELIVCQPGELYIYCNIKIILIYLRIF